MTSSIDSPLLAPISENPKHESSSVFITPPDSIRQLQRNKVVPTVGAKKDHHDHDTFLKSKPWTRSQGKHTDPSGRGRDTPGSTTSLAEDDTSTDPGSSVKRKLELDLLLDSPSEPLQMLKNGKPSSWHLSRHLPLVPDTKRVKRKNPKVSCSIIPHLSTSSSPRKTKVNRKNAKGMSLLTVENKAGYTPVGMAQTEDMKEALLGQRLEVSGSPAIEEENQNNASTSKEPDVRRSPSGLKGGSRLQSNTNVKDRSRETLSSTKTNSGTDEGSAMAKLPSEKDDASVTPVSPWKIIDKILLRVARLVPMDKVFDLGTALDIDYAQIERYNARNHDSHGGFEGTLKMLQDWNLQHEGNVIPDLVSALKEAKMSSIPKRLKLNTL